MSKLEQLIEEFCPDGVEYKKLEQCCNILDRQRKPVTKLARESGDYPYYGANGIQDYVSDYIFDGTFILVGEDGSVMNKNGNPVVTWAQGKIWVNNHAHIIEEIEGVLLRYLYHYIQNVDVTLLIHGNIPKLTGRDFKDILIPLPHIEIQREIVHVLDDFTELTARKKQYEYYRNYLLSKNRKFDIQELGTFCDIGDGLHGTPMYEDSGEYYFINGNNLITGKIQYGSTTKKIGKNEYERLKIDFSKNTILMSINGTIGNMAFYNGEYIALGKSVAYFSIKDRKLNSQYLYHYLQSQDAQDYFVSQLTGTTIKNLGLKALRSYTIPLPPIDVQERIVDILDRFDTLCNDISKGLPAEIEARQKQYEYYRDKLLMFKNIDAEE